MAAAAGSYSRAVFSLRSVEDDSQSEDVSVHPIALSDRQPVGRRSVLLMAVKLCCRWGWAQGSGQDVRTREREKNKAEGEGGMAIPADAETAGRAEDGQ